MLFGNIDEVCQISEELIAAMEEEKEQIGSVFVRMSKVLLEVYTAYCKSHNLATLALKKVLPCPPSCPTPPLLPHSSLSPNPPLQYKEDPATAAKLHVCMETVQGKTSSWDRKCMLYYRECHAVIML